MYENFNKKEVREIEEGETPTEEDQGQCGSTNTES